MEEFFWKPLRQAGIAHEGDVWSAEVTVNHPEAGVRVKDTTEFEGLGVHAHAHGNFGGCVAMLSVVFWAHLKIAINDFVGIAVVWKAHDFGIGPDFFPGLIVYRNHENKLSDRVGCVEVGTNGCPGGGGVACLRGVGEGEVDERLGVPEIEFDCQGVCHFDRDSRSGFFGFGGWE